MTNLNLIDHENRINIQLRNYKTNLKLVRDNIIKGESIYKVCRKYNISMTDMHYILHPIHKEIKASERLRKAERRQTVISMYEEGETLEYIKEVTGYTNHIIKRIIEAHKKLLEFRENK